MSKQKSTPPVRVATDHRSGEKTKKPKRPQLWPDDPTQSAVVPVSSGTTAKASHAVVAANGKEGGGEAKTSGKQRKAQKSVSFKISITEEEDEKLKHDAEAAGMSKDEYLKELLSKYRIQPKAKRTVRFDMRMTEEEDRVLREDAADIGMSRSEYVGSLIMKRRIKKPAPIQLNFDKAALVEVSHIIKKTAANLNQLMHYANAGKYIDPAEVERNVKANRAAVAKLVALIDEARG